MIKLKFDEKRDIKNAIENTKTIIATEIRQYIWYAAVYFTKIEPVECIFDAVVDYMTAHSPDFQYEGYLSAINKCLRRAENYQLKYVECVPITQSDINFILSFDDLRQQKLSFVLIALARYYNALNQNENNFVFAKTSDIFKMARVSIPASQRDYYFHFAYASRLLTPNTSVGYNLLTVNLTPLDGDGVVLNLDEYDFLELAYAFLNYKNGGYKRCKTCQRWFKLKKSAPAQLYCAEHQGVPLTKQCVCQDCGVVFEVSNKNNKTYRCQSCQEKHNKMLKSQWYYINKENLETTN